MFAANSMEDIASSYRNNGEIVSSGVWSILLTKHQGTSVEFAKRYFSIFNEIVGQGWHLAILAEAIDADGGRKWKESAPLHSLGLGLLQKIYPDLNDAPDLLIVFFDPHKEMNESLMATIPLDADQMGNIELYKQGFQATHSAIMAAFRRLNIDRYRPVPTNKYGELLKQIERELRKKRIQAALKLVFGWIGLGPAIDLINA